MQGIRVYRHIFTILMVGTLIIIFYSINKTLHAAFFSLPCSANELSIERSTENITTVVVGFYPLNKSKHTTAKYLVWLENLLGYCRAPMIIFTSIEYQPILWKLRRNNTLASYFIVDYSTPFEMPPIRPLVSVFEQQHWTDPERVYHSVELYAIWCAKSFMINRSAELNPFQTKYFLYVDAGAFRSREYRFQVWPHDQTIRKIFAQDRLLLGMIAPLPHQFCPLGYEIVDGPIKIDLIEGGFIGGSARSIRWWTSIFYETINNYHENNHFIGKDQYVMNAIALRYASRLNIMLSFRVFCDDVWFAFAPLLANSCEKRALSYTSRCQKMNISALVIPFETICNETRNLI